MPTCQATEYLMDQGDVLMTFMKDNAIFAQLQFQ